MGLEFLDSYASRYTTLKLLIIKKYYDIIYGRPNWLNIKNNLRTLGHDIFDTILR